MPAFNHGGTMKSLAVFGATGSIGANTLDVVRRNPGLFSIRYLATNRNVETLLLQAAEFHPAAVALADAGAAAAARERLGSKTEVLAGVDGLLELARRSDYDVMVSSLVGFAGVLPTLAAIELGRKVALANKETLVAAGEVITAAMAVSGAQLLPIDSEHSAILQCLNGENKDSAGRLVLTASGGPFRGRNARSLENVTAAEALAHPVWNMGRKITIDSATLMNKGLEVIEAHWLFGLPPDRIDVIVHPQSIVHSFVEFRDGSLKAQLGMPDMRIPIQYALSWPDRIETDYPRLDLSLMSALTFEEADRGTFRCLALAESALRCGGTAPAALNAANEVAVQGFLDGRILFSDIPRLIEDALEKHGAGPAGDIAAVIEADREIRLFAEDRLRKQQRHIQPVTVS